MFSRKAICLLLTIPSICGMSVREWFSALHGSFSPLVPLQHCKYDFFRRFGNGYMRGMFHSFFVPTIGYKEDPYTSVNNVNGLFLYDMHQMIRRSMTEDQFYKNPEQAWLDGLNVLKLKFCQIAKKAAGCCKAEPNDVQECRKTPSGLPEVMVSIFDTMEQLKFAFLYFWCFNTRIFLKKGVLINGTIFSSFNEMCPNPCRNFPCKGKFGIGDDEKCTRPLGGMFEHEFICDCADGMAWSTEAEMCFADSKCARSSPTACNELGTESCEMQDKDFKCHCKPEFAGETCTRKRNPCDSRYKQTSQPGNELCNSIQGNTCIPLIGSDEFVCNCSVHWEHDPSHVESNCLRRVDNCIFRNCFNNATCASAPDLSMTGCTCRLDSSGRSVHDGKNCELDVNHWYNWGPWTECRPPCGFQRYRIRRRTCPSGKKRCIGDDEMIAACEAEKMCPQIGNRDYETPLINETQTFWVCFFCVLIQIGGSYAISWLCRAQKSFLKAIWRKLKAKGSDAEDTETDFKMREKLLKAFSRQS